MLYIHTYRNNTDQLLPGLPGSGLFSGAGGTDERDEAEEEEEEVDEVLDFGVSRLA